MATAASKIAEYLPDSAMSGAIAMAHRRFEPVLRHVRSLLAPGQTAIDVGAWYGPWTYWLSRFAHEVVTVEPNPDLAAFIARTTRPNVTVIAKAASEEPGTAQLWLPPGGRGTEGRASLSTLPDGRTITVETFRLDSLDVDDVGLIKIDVEGHELSALRGAEGLIRKWRPNLLVEIEVTRVPAEPTLAFIESFGYRGWILQHGQWRLLGKFDLAEHQFAMKNVASKSYLNAIVKNTGKKFVNNILFRPTPGQ